MKKKKRILVASFDLAIGGVERSLIGLLNTIDYSKYDVDLMLYRHEGEFLSLLPLGPKLLTEVPLYSTFRKSIVQVFREGHTTIGVSRLLARYLGTWHGKLKGIKEPGYLSIQYGWALSNHTLPTCKEEYDLAISFLWPHYFVGSKVKAKRKVGWVHTDYSKIYINKGLERKMWRQMDDIVAVSEECKNSFIHLFPEYKDRTVVIENIISPTFVRQQGEEDIFNEMKSKPGRIKLLTVGRLTHAKGLDDAVYACKKLLDNGMDIEWFVVGYGGLEGEIRNLIVELGIQDRFFLLGKKVNPYPYIKECDIYVQPSRYEGKAVTVREAQILGKPVLITNFPTAQSQVRDGIDGIITPMGIDGIVRGVKQLIVNKELRDRLTQNTLGTNYSNSNEIEKIYSFVK